MFDLLIPFIAILNPFALCLYLEGVARDLSMRQYLSVILSASLISLCTFWVFAIIGESLLVKGLNVRPEALRAFGGAIFFMIAYRYVTQGYKAVIGLRGSLDELPAAIALPFMIGAGTITQSILIGRNLAPFASLLVLAMGVSAAIGILVIFKLVHDLARRRGEKVIDRYVNMLARINGLIIGAVSTEMILGSLPKFLNLD